MAEEKEMSFLDHLEEMRWRLVKAVIAIVIFAICAFLAKDFIFDTIILAPKNGDFITYTVLCKLSALLGLGTSLCLEEASFTLQNISMSGQFSTHILVSFIAGIIVAFPYVFSQIWSFIKPGLKDKERKSARGVVWWSSILFFAGVLFGYYLLAPLSVQFLGNYKVSEVVTNQISLTSFITTVTTVTLATGLFFELPIVIYFLTKAGIVNAKLLKKLRKHAFVTVLVLAAIITPPDITSQILVTVPIMFLYEASILVSKRVEKKMKP
jgi:sec-independent protein translocase protein TatC